jgi:CBS domain containing-hemolysin-like protein
MAEDTLGPVLIDEVHKSGQEFVLVREAKKGPVIGSLEFAKLGLGSKGKVRDLMNPTVYYIHENDTLTEALHAFFVTNQPMFVVVNSFEEFIGILTVENILHQLLGHIPGDDFDQYTNLAAVAARHKKLEKESDEVKADKTPVKTDQEVVE